MKKHVIKQLMIAGVITLSVLAVPLPGAGGAQNMNLFGPQTVYAQTATAERPITVTIDGVQQNFEVPPQLIGGRTFLPLRAIGEALGYRVDFDSASNTATMTNGTTTIMHTVGTRNIYVNGEVRQGDVVSLNSGGRILVPVRMLSEATGAQVSWDSVTYMVTITRPASAPMQTASAPTVQTLSTSPAAAGFTGTPIIFDSPQLLSGAELDALIARAPTANETASSINLRAGMSDIDVALLFSVTVADNGQAMSTRAQNQLILDHYGSPAEASARHEADGRAVRERNQMTDAQIQAWYNEYVAMGGINRQELEAVKYVNELRVAEGLAPLRICPLTSVYSRFRAHQMTDFGYTSHGSIELETSQGFFSLPGIGSIGTLGASATTGGGGPGDTQGVHVIINGWMRSTGHRAQLMNPDIQYIGVGAYIGGSGGQLYIRTR